MCALTNPGVSCAGSLLKPSKEKAASEELKKERGEMGMHWMQSLSKLEALRFASLTIKEVLNIIKINLCTFKHNW
jgi:hypothetical protein